ncbi:hypothetical protein [Metallibacterium sp.]|uniref:hypothetical protein n=1 Tax=Metallibacterium sp. TaxID=2940281 RepID=UPI00262E792B|nr:hypothetical protein [Metallibacterium sp.]
MRSDTWIKASLPAARQHYGHFDQGRPIGRSDRIWVTGSLHAPLPPIDNLIQQLVETIDLCEPLRWFAQAIQASQVLT